MKLSSPWKMNVFDRTDAMGWYTRSDDRDHTIVMRQFYCDVIICVLSAIDAEEGLLRQSRDPQGWHGTRGNKGVHSAGTSFVQTSVTSRDHSLKSVSPPVSGKYYFEAKVTDEGLCRVGWSTLNAKLDLGTDRDGFGFGGTGKKSFGRQFDSYGEVRYHDVMLQRHRELVQRFTQPDVFCYSCSRTEWLTSSAATSTLTR